MTVSNFDDKVISFADRVPERLKSGGGGGTSDGMEQRVKELEKTYLQVAVDIASIKAKVEDMPSKDWVHLRLWAVAAVVIAAVGLMIRFISPAG